MASMLKHNAFGLTTEENVQVNQVRITLGVLYEHMTAYTNEQLVCQNPALGT